MKEAGTLPGFPGLFFAQTVPAKCTQSKPEATTGSILVCSYCLEILLTLLEWPNHICDQSASPRVVRSSRACDEAPFHRCFVFTACFVAHFFSPVPGSLEVEGLLRFPANFCELFTIWKVI